MAKIDGSSNHVESSETEKISSFWKQTCKFFPVERIYSRWLGWWFKLNVRTFWWLKIQ